MGIDVNDEKSSICRVSHSYKRFINATTRDEDEDGHVYPVMPFAANGKFKFKFAEVIFLMHRIQSIRFDRLTRNFNGIGERTMKIE